MGHLFAEPLVWFPQSCLLCPLTAWSDVVVADAREVEERQRAHEYLRSLTVLPGVWLVIRLDGDGFSGLTETCFEKPFDAGFRDVMVAATKYVQQELGARFAYTASDEISLLFDPSFARYGRGVEKLLSLSAGMASAAFTHEAKLPARFDSRIWAGANVSDVVEYFSWRQSDASRNALNGWCYWTLRKSGDSAKRVTERLRGASTSDKNELLFQHGVNFSKVPAWQRRGVGLWWEPYETTGHDPIRDVPVVAIRRRLRIDDDLPMRQGFRDLVRRVIIQQN